MAAMKASSSGSASARRKAKKKGARRKAARRSAASKKPTARKGAIRKRAVARKKGGARRKMPTRAEASRAIARLRRDMAARNETMKQHPYLERVRRFVEPRLGQRMTLERVAGVAGLEETYFSAYFHTTVGLTYSQWLSGLRVIAAVDQMQGQHASMETAARKAGFGHLRTLQRSFKRRLGLPPRAYKT